MSDQDIVNFNMNLKKKKKKRKVKRVTTPALDTYSYHCLLKRCYALMDDVPVKQIRIPNPIITRSGRSIQLVNFQKICLSIHRNPMHVKTYILSELSIRKCDASINSTGALIIKGKFVSTQIKTLIHKYIVQFVQCKTCKNMDTSIIKDAATRLYSLHCGVCKVCAVVTWNITDGFIAESRKSRRHK